MVYDAGERENVYDQYPEKVDELTRLLHRALICGRTTTGSIQEKHTGIAYEDWDGVVWLSELPEAFIEMTE
jgi:hypothetical protein